jgi:trk system potassium uptake protein TrkA
LYCLIVGGGKIGYNLARQLQGEGHEVAVVEIKPVRCRRLEHELGEDLVIYGDGARPAVLEQAGCARADVVVAVTGDDAVNLLVAQVSRRRFGVQRTIARLNNPRNQHVFAALGIEGTVSSTAIIADLIEREVATRQIKTLLSFKSGEITIVEIDLPRGAPAVGRCLRDLSFPEGSLLVTVLRGNDVIVPSGSTVLEPDDRLIALSNDASEAALRSMLLGEVQP